MSNHIIIDGWNVCWKIPALAEMIPTDLEGVRSRFNQLVAGHFAAKKLTYQIVYDGQPQFFTDLDRSDKKVLFSRNPEKADDLIIRHLIKQRNKKNWTVVSSDNRLSRQAEDLGAKTISSEEFIKRLNRRKPEKPENIQKSNPRLDQNELNYWLDKFSNDPDE
jgi:predicted RNA-binding protein with PIN domain